MVPNLPPQLFPYATEYERLLIALVSVESQDGSSWFDESEAKDLLKEAGIVSRAYIEYTQKYSGFHDQYFTDMAEYLMALSENLTKRRTEYPQTTPPLSYTFPLRYDKTATGAAVGIALIHAIETIRERIQELKLEEFIARKPDILARQACKKAVIAERIKELYDKAFAGDAATDAKGLVNLAKNALEEKRAVSANLSIEPELDQLIWRCHLVERFLDDVHVMMDAHKDDKKSEVWKENILKLCQIASDNCEGLKEEVVKYLDLNPGSLLPQNAANILPVIVPNKLISLSYQELSTQYSMDLKGFIDFVTGAMKETENRKLEAELECVLIQHLLDLRERQLAKQHSTYVTVAPIEPSGPLLSAPLLLMETGGYSLDDYVEFVVGLRLKGAQRVYVLSQVWNQQLTWLSRYMSRSEQEKKRDLSLFDPIVQKELEELISDGRDPTRPNKPLGWWKSDE
ncbi:hypothetical protein B0J17DRAFT_735681 [Rhizoctonia solani]|nr:hypothetical protein B0J17DRAFT_735681 [Rhizoctonia solani]